MGKVLPVGRWVKEGWKVVRTRDFAKSDKKPKESTGARSKLHFVNQFLRPKQGRIYSFTLQNFLAVKTYATLRKKGVVRANKKIILSISIAYYWQSNKIFNNHTLKLLGVITAQAILQCVISFHMKENSLLPQHILSAILFKGHLYCHQHAYNIIIQQQKVNSMQLQKELDDSTSIKYLWGLCS